MRGRTWVVAASIVAALVLALEAGSRVGGESAERRVRGYFSVPGALDSVSLRAAVLREIPIGSPESRLDDFVAARGIGTDGSSGYSPARDLSAAIRVDSKPAPLNPITETYSIGFDFDSVRHLRAVRVHHAFTGP